MGHGSRAPGEVEDWGYDLEDFESHGFSLCKIKKLV